MCTIIVSAVTARSQSAHCHRSFRYARLTSLTLRDVTNHIVEFAQDQYGSRFIQQKLEQANAVDKTAVFREVLPHSYRLMMDVFGNYVIQKFFELGTPEQKQASIFFHFLRFLREIINRSCDGLLFFRPWNYFHGLIIPIE